LEGKKVKLVNECVLVESRFKAEDGSPKQENQVKLRVQGVDGVMNARLNWTTVYALIEAFGRESKLWIGHTLTAKVKDATTGQSLYLIPEGFELVRDPETKRWTIRKIADVVPEPEPVNDPAEPEIKYPEEDIDPADIPWD
jgi:hypothetical protein